MNTGKFFQMNSTLKTFNYPENLIKEFEYWVLVLRPAQITYGSMVLCVKGEKSSFSNLSELEINEYSKILLLIDKVSREVLGSDKMNYLTLMMVDPHVHTHIFPRYKISNNSITDLKDQDWPNLPNLNRESILMDEEFFRLLDKLVMAYE